MLLLACGDRSKSGLKAWKSHESLLSSTTLTLPSGKTKTAANTDLYRSTLQREYLSELGADYSGSRWRHFLTCSYRI